MNDSNAFASTFYFLPTRKANNKKNKKSLQANAQGQCKLDTAYLRPNKATSANKGFAIAGVPCLADSFVQGGSSVLRMKFSAKTPRHRKPPKRYPQIKIQHPNRRIYENILCN